MRTSKQIHASDFPDLATRRTWLSSLPDEAPQVLAWPTMERLQRQDLPAARSLARYAKLMDPQRFIAVNDNDAAASDPEFHHEIRPTPKELIEAADKDLVVTFSSVRNANDSWAIRTIFEPLHKGEEHCDSRPVLFRNGQVHVGALAFYRGKLLEWGMTKKGKRLCPREICRNSRGSQDRSAARRDVRYLLPANDNTPIAKGAGFLGGKVGNKGTAQKPVGNEYNAEIIRNTEATATRMKLGIAAAVLDLAITDATAREIGEAAGYRGKNAERRGKRLIADALKKFEEIAVA